MRIGRALLALPAVAILLAAPALRAETLSIAVDYQERQIALSSKFDKPDGAGPFPAVILLHGCGGNNAYAQARSEMWAAMLHEQGYATLIIDSFSARGFSDICNNTRLVEPAERAKDIYAAAFILAQRPDVRADRIAAIGFSHGGSTVLRAAADGQGRLAGWRERLAGHGRIAAIIGFYPGCHEAAHRSFVVPTLVLVGANDDWSRAAWCQELAAEPRAQSSELRLKVFPGAYHDFDVNTRPQIVVGHHLAYDAAAAQDARAQVIEFFKQYLQ